MEILDHPVHLDWLKTSGAGAGAGVGGAQCYILELGCSRISFFYVCIYNFKFIFQNTIKILLKYQLLLLLLLLSLLLLYYYYY